MLLACPNCATSYEVKSTVLGETGRSLRCARCQTVWFATPSLATTIEERIAAFAAPETFTQSLTETGPPTAKPPTATPDQTASGQAMPTASLAEISIPTAEAPPLAPTTPNTTPSPSTTTLTAAGEDIETFARRYAEDAADRAARLRAKFGPLAVILVLAIVTTTLMAWRVSIVRLAPQMASFYAFIGLPVNLRELIFGNVNTAKETRDGVSMLMVEGTIVSTAKHPVEVPRLRFALRNETGQEIYAWTAQPDHSILAPGGTLPFRSRLAAPPSDGRNVVVRFFNRRDTAEGPR